MPKYNDFLVSGISSQIQQYIHDFDLLIKTNSIDFKTSNLLKDSVVRLSIIATIPSKIVIGKIGHISAESHNLLISRLCKYLNNR
jgi:mRNA interferase MazF